MVVHAHDAPGRRQCHCHVHRVPPAAAPEVQRHQIQLSFVFVVVVVVVATEAFRVVRDPVIIFFDLQRRRCEFEPP